MNALLTRIASPAISGCALVLLLSACAVGPDYRRPAVVTTENYKEAADWRPSEPSDAMTRGPWWELFGDAELSQLEGQIVISNQNVKAAAAAFDQSRALVA